MFFQPITSLPDLPSDQEIGRIKVQSVAKFLPLDWDEAKAKGLNRQEFSKLRRKWKDLAVKGSVRDPNHFAVCLELDFEEEVYAVAEYEDGRVSIDVISAEDVDEKLLPIVDFSGQIISEIRIQPNQKCPCKSGKKYKKCCGSVFR